MFDTGYAAKDTDQTVVVNSYESQEQAKALADSGAAPQWGLTATQRAVLEPPYAKRVDRPVLRPVTTSSSSSNQSNSDDAEDAQQTQQPLYGVTVVSRSAEKKLFDRTVFKNEYF